MSWVWVDFGTSWSWVRVERYEMARYELTWVRLHQHPRLMPYNAYYLTSSTIHVNLFPVPVQQGVVASIEATLLTYLIPSDPLRRVFGVWPSLPVQLGRWADVSQTGAAGVGLLHILNVLFENNNNKEGHRAMDSVGTARGGCIEH